MAEIAVYHPIFGTGGGEAVCMNVLEALQGDYSVDLYTLSEINISDLNEYFNTNVSPSIPVLRGNLGTKALKYSYEFWRAVSESGLGRFHASVFGGLLRRQLSEYDLVISTFGEFHFDTKTIQYVHYPMFNRRAIPDDIESRGTLRTLHDEACDILSGNRRRGIDDVVLANSEWTANLTENVHGVPVECIYPPVDTSNFHPKPCEEREEGLVAIGRIAPSKRIEALIDIVEGLQQRGHDVPLHIVGPTSNEEYYRTIRPRVAQNELITLEGKVSRERLIEFICSYKYGLHGMHYEHFGIAVAEFVAGGAIPFIHNSGGQREIVNGEQQLCYDSVSDAIDKIEGVLNSSDEQARLRENLVNVEAHFGKSRFHHEIRQVVDEALGE